MSDELVLDTLAPLSHKRGLTETIRSGWQAPTWIGDHQRRLTGYKILKAYIDNCGRHFANYETPKDRDERREYGDAALLVDVARSKVLGEDVQLVVENADTDLPEPPEEGDDPAADERIQRDQARERQDWLRDWARAERMRLKMTEVERDSVGLGDGVYALGWSSTKGRVRLRVFDPGFYFPVLSDGDEDDYPPKVHIAWELPPDADAPGVMRVRRITYQLVPLDETERNGRRLAYQAAGEAPARQTCLLTDAIYTVQRDNRSVEDFTDRSATYLLNEDGQEIRDVDLDIDFIPVIHVPNTVAIKEHYGRSILLAVAQVLDEIHSADTDLSGNAATTGSPPITASGLAMPAGENGKQGAVVTYGPGQMYRLADGGRMDVLDTSGGMDAMLRYLEALLKRLSVNSRFPQEVLGRVSAAEVPSGFAMALAFGPLQGLVDEMRLVRDEKYRLLLKMVQRLATQAGSLPAGEALPAWVVFGSYLPSDLPGVVQVVRDLLQAKAVSRLTAINLLIEAGLPIEDAQEELARIEAEDFEAASLLLEASGDEAAVRARLGLEEEGPRPAGPPELPEGTIVLPVPGAPVT